VPRFAANLTLMFTEWVFLDRFAAAADAGFRAVEFLFPYDHAPEAVAAAAERAGVAVVLFNLPPGDWAAGDRGLAAVPGREGDFRAGVETALTQARALRAVGSNPRLHAMAGIADPADPAAQAAYRANVAAAADRLGDDGVALTIEPINRRSLPGYFLADFDLADRVLADLGRPNLALQFDVFHRQILRGDVIEGLRAAIGRIGHVQIAGVPDRHEPDTGEVAYPAVFAELDRLDYGGWVGCEYVPAGRTDDGLAWIRPWLDRGTGGHGP
jgi:hydroxypyruvate isomerase